MKVIKLLSEKIHDELDDACSYAKLAIEYKDSYRSVGETFYSLAQEEMRHHMMLHNEAVQLIDTYRRENGEPPERMLAVYDYLHEQAIDKAEKVKRYLAMYKD